MSGFDEAISALKGRTVIEAHDRRGALCLVLDDGKAVRVCGCSVDCDGCGSHMSDGDSAYCVECYASPFKALQDPIRDVVDTARVVAEASHVNTIPCGSFVDLQRAVRTAFGSTRADEPCGPRCDCGACDR